MDSSDGTRVQRERRHRFLVAVLFGLLAAFAVWCLGLLWRAEGLQDELDLYFGWIEEVHAIRTDLEDREPEGAAAAEPLEAFYRRTEALARQTEDPELLVRVRRLRLALSPLIDDPTAARNAPSSEARWRASVEARAATEALEDGLRRHLFQLHRRLGQHWRSLWWLVVGSLLLAASNSGLLVLVHRRRLALERAHSRVLASARHDSLTGLWNREAIRRLLGQELVRAARTGVPLGAILADLDRFQRVNDLVGQDQGDDILRQVAGRLSSLVRPYDTLGRYGGDAFLLVLPACDATSTTQVADRLREAVNEHDVEYAFGRLRVRLNLAHRTLLQPGEADADGLVRELEVLLEASKGASA